MNPGRSFSRRAFLRGAAISAAGLALPAIVPSRVFSANAPSNRITIASIGLGAMGGYHLNALVNMEECRVVALCDVDRTKLEAANAIAKLPAESLYTDFQEVLARRDIDAVNIATPDHWHTPLAIEAIKAGKAVYVQKPISLNIAEGRALSDLSRRLGAIVQTGSQQRSSAPFRYASELVRNGYLGKIERIEVGLEKPYLMEPGLEPPSAPPDTFDYNRWLGPATFKPYSPQRVIHFRGCFEYSGGYYSDWGAHHLDIVQWALGKDDSGPILADGQGVFHTEGIFDVPMSYMVRYEYDNGIPVFASEKYEQGIRFIGSEGTLFVSRTKSEATPRSLLSIQLQPRDTRLQESPHHLRNFFDSVRRGVQPIVPPEIGHRSATVCHLGNLSMRLGRPLEWDPVTESFKNDPEASRMRGAATTAPWRLI